MGMEVSTRTVSPPRPPRPFPSRCQTKMSFLKHFRGNHKVFPYRHCRCYGGTQEQRILIDLPSRIKDMVQSREPQLTRVNQYYLEGGKFIRPRLLLSLAADLSRYLGNAGITQLQEKLTEIVELIHAASLLHDDVVDGASDRRGRPTANQRFGVKSAVLSGDYLLAQASVELADLGHLGVIRLLATVIKDLVEGELMQMNGTLEEQLSMEFYLRKSYLKTASLLSKSSQAMAVLAGPTGSSHCQACYEFGKSLGLAFQAIDDKLDYTGRGEVVGKPVGADLRNGIITAPVLFALEERPELGDLIGRRFERPDDYDIMIDAVQSSNALKRTQDLADQLLERAFRSIEFLTPSQELVSLVTSVTSRSY